MPALEGHKRLNAAVCELPSQKASPMTEKVKADTAGPGDSRGKGAQTHPHSKGKGQCATEPEDRTFQPRKQKGDHSETNTPGKQKS